MPSNSIVYQATEIKKLDPGFVKSLATSVVSDSQHASTISSSRDSSTEDTYEEDSKSINEDEEHRYNKDKQFPINVKKRIANYYVDSNYKNETICVLVQITNTGGITQYNIDLREIMPDAVSIINCSIPMKMSSIDEILRYQRNKADLIPASELSNPKMMIKKMTEDDLLRRFLSTNFSEEAKAIANRTYNDDNHIKRTILKELNRIISEEQLYNYLRIDEKEQKNQASQTCKLLSINNRSGLQKIDSYILNFMLLRDLYPSFITKPDGYFTVYDNFSVDESIGTINIPISNLRPKESLLFTYYANISQPGKFSMDTLIGLPEEDYLYTSFPLEASFIYPSFDVKVVPFKESGDPGDAISLKYIIEMPSIANRTFNHVFDAEINDNTNSMELNESKFQLEFSNNNASVTKTIQIKINESGSYNIPSITIKRTEYMFPDKYILIEERWHKYIAELSLIFLGLCTLLGSNFEAIQSKQRHKLLVIALTLISFWVLNSLLELSSIQFFMGIIIIILIVIYLYSDWIKSKCPR